MAEMRARRRRDWCRPVGRLGGRCGCRERRSEGLGAELWGRILDLDL